MASKSFVLVSLIWFGEIPFLWKFSNSSRNIVNKWSIFLNQMLVLLRKKSNWTWVKIKTFIIFFKKNLSFLKIFRSLKTYRILKWVHSIGKSCSLLVNKLVCLCSYVSLSVFWVFFFSLLQWIWGAGCWVIRAVLSTRWNYGNEVTNLWAKKLE